MSMLREELAWKIVNDIITAVINGGVVYND